MKNRLSIFLSFLMMLSSLSVCTFAADTDVDMPFSYDICSEKSEYEKGEEIFICVSVKDTSLDTVSDMRFWIDYPLTDYYLTPGVTERFVDYLDGSETLKFRIVEDGGVLDFASRFEKTTVIRGFLLKLAHAYKSLTLVYASVRYGLKNAFLSFNQKQNDLGTVTVKYDDTEIPFSVRCRYSVKKTVSNEIMILGNEQGTAEAEITALDNSYTGIVFAAEKTGDNFGLFAVNPDFGKAFIFNVCDGKYNIISSKSVDIEPGKNYRMKTYFDGNRLVCSLLNNRYDESPFPVFDIYYDSEETGCGVFCQKDGYSDFSIDSQQMEQYENSYTNPIYDNAPDPYILKDGEMYYLYATTSSTRGFQVSQSTDLVNWKNLGFCGEKGQIYGSEKFWAPEVYKYNGKYYLLYSTDEHIALAVSDSPAGPFTKTKDGYLLEDNCIDGHFMFDDDGSIYLYMAYWAETGEEIWGCKMNTDLSGIVPSTLTRLTSCQENEGGVNEGPAMLKYQGKYYLTYSVNGYTLHNYSVKLAVSDSPLGTFVSRGLILEKSGPIVGTGHHSFTTSPDGTELIIAYHCHYSTTRIHNRQLCIDRCKFVQTEDGYTISVYGPTSTAQPYPSSDKK